MSVVSPKCSQVSVSAVWVLGTGSLCWEGLVKNVGFEPGVKWSELSWTV